MKPWDLSRGATVSSCKDTTCPSNDAEEANLTHRESRMEAINELDG